MTASVFIAMIVCVFAVVVVRRIPGQGRVSRVTMRFYRVRIAMPIV